MATTPKRVLIVDDDHDFRAVLSKRLSNEGYEVLESEDGSDCLIKAAVLRPHLILLDLFLPMEDGAVVCKTLKEHSATSSIPVIIITASPFEVKIDECRKNGARDYLIKGEVSGSEICERVREIIQEYVCQSQESSEEANAVTRAI